MSEAELLPCPFCGGMASVEHVDKVWEVGCDHFDVDPSGKDCCGSGIGSSYATKREAIKAWNTRTHSTDRSTE